MRVCVLCVLCVCVSLLCPCVLGAACCVLSLFITTALRCDCQCTYYSPQPVTIVSLYSVPFSC